MYVNPGVFNKKIEIISYSITKDDDGFESKQENIILKTWAQISNTSGTEILRSDSDFSQVKTRFFIRTPKVLINKDMVIKFRNQIYEIVYVNDYEYNKKYTEIMSILITK